MPKNTQPLVGTGSVLVLAGLPCLTTSEFLARSTLASNLRFVKKVSNSLTWVFASRHQRQLRVPKTVLVTQFLRHPPPSEEVVGDIAAPLLRCPRDGERKSAAEKFSGFAADRTLVRYCDHRHVLVTAGT